MARFSRKEKAAICFNARANDAWNYALFYKMNTFAPISQVDYVHYLGKNGIAMSNNLVIASSDKY